MRRAVLALAALVLVLNSNALDAFFIGDDFDFLRLIGRRDSWTEVAALEFWGEWEPLWYLTWHFDLALWGYRAFGFHLTNTVWLGLVVVALYGLVRELWPAATVAPWAAALLFATNPVHDEAVVYLAARGHVMCTALMLVSLWLFARARRPGQPTRHATLWLAGALVAGFLAALAKETALILPAWIASVELFCGAKRSRGKTAMWAAIAAIAFAAAGLSSLALRNVVVGLDSEKLTGPGADLTEFMDDVLDDVPAYALLGAVPLPFAHVHEPVLTAWRPLGWLVIAAVAAGAIALLWRARRDEALGRAAGLWCLGIVVALTALAPVFWADLPVRRRYLFVPTIGVALVAGPIFEWLNARRPRIAAGLLGALVLAGGISTWQRHELWREAGRVTRGMIETVRGAPLGSDATRGEDPVAFITLPGRYGGDGVSGVYLVHHTDLASALALFGAPQPEIIYAMRFYHADDHQARVVESTPERLLVRFTFRTRRAYSAALEEDPAEEGRGGLLKAERVASDELARTLDYAVSLSPRLGRERFTLLLYSDGELEELTTPR